jgi:hypothetical protein
MRRESASRIGQVSSWLILSAIVPRGFPAWDNGLEKQVVGLFHVRNEIDMLHDCEANGFRVSAKDKMRSNER